MHALLRRLVRTNYLPKTLTNVWRDGKTAKCWKMHEKWADGIASFHLSTQTRHFVSFDGRSDESYRFGWMDGSFRIVRIAMKMLNYLRYLSPHYSIWILICTYVLFCSYFRSFSLEFRFVVKQYLVPPLFSFRSKCLCILRNVTLITDFQLTIFAISLGPHNKIVSTRAAIHSHATIIAYNCPSRRKQHNNKWRNEPFTAPNNAKAKGYFKCEIDKFCGKRKPFVSDTIFTMWN